MPNTPYTYLPFLSNFTQIKGMSNEKAKVSLLAVFHKEFLLKNQKIKLNLAKSLTC